jgi:hypothetical protein
MKIECSRQLSDIETTLHSARMIEASWAGFGLYKTLTPDEVQKYKEDTANVEQPNSSGCRCLHHEYTALEGC